MNAKPKPRADLDRKSLSFVTLHRAGYGIHSHWDVPHDPTSCWHQGKKIGRAFFAEVAQLAAAKPDAARIAIICALNDHGWRSGGWGIEQGFSEALAEYALIGMAATRNKGGQP